MKGKVSRIHFVGIGGTGMCGIAEVLHNLGYQVSGSDLHYNSATQHLQAIGVKVYEGHAPEQVKDAQVIVTSTAVSESNPEVVAAVSANIPVIRRAMMLSELMRFKRGIAVAGTHGKTTTTSMTAAILDAANFDPTYVIGGRLNSVASNAKLGKGDYIVAEADESDASFLYLNPLYAIVTNIDEEHMQSYEFSVDKLRQSFISFVHRLPFYGKAFLCIESENVRAILPDIQKPYATYGLSDNADFFATDIKAVNLQMQFTVNSRQTNELLRFPVVLNFPGQHSVLNALAAIAISLECEADVAAIQEGLAKFQGVDRRFQRYGEVPLPQGGSIQVVDDYAHHPNEIKATLQAARQAFQGQRLTLVFQPHRYTRTRDHFDDFIEALRLADLIILTEVYAAGEAPIAAADGKALARSLCTHFHLEPIYQSTLEKLPETILEVSRDQDVVLTMGAGSITKVAAWLKDLAEQGQHT